MILVIFFQCVNKGTMNKDILLGQKCHEYNKTEMGLNNIEKFVRLERDVTKLWNKRGINFEKI